MGRQIFRADFPCRFSVHFHLQLAATALSISARLQRYLLYSKSFLDLAPPSTICSSYMSQHWVSTRETRSRCWVLSVQAFIIAYTVAYRTWKENAAPGFQCTNTRSRVASPLFVFIVLCMQKSPVQFMYIRQGRSAVDWTLHHLQVPEQSPIWF